MFDNHGYKNIVTYPTGVTKQNIKMQKTSEIQRISEVFRYPQTAFRRIILKLRGVPKGYTADRCGDCTLARVLKATVQRVTPIMLPTNHRVAPTPEGTVFHRIPDCTLDCTLGRSYRCGFQIIVLKFAKLRKIL